MKKHLLVFCITLLSTITSLRTSAQSVTFDWSCFPTSGTILADNNGIANLNLSTGNCSVANGWVLQCQGTGEQRILSSALGGNPYIRMQKVGTDATFNFARFLTASGSLFTLRSISVTPTSVGAAAGGAQVITLHAYKGGREQGSTSTASLGTITLVNIPESQLGAFVNIDEVRLTSDKSAAFGVGVDDIVIVQGAVIPTVATGAPAAITASSATLTGNVSSDGGTLVTEKGVVYATTANPTTANSKITNGAGTGAISVNAAGLAGSTTYHVRAYATNGIGTAYGADKTFTTLAANQAPVLTASAGTTIFSGPNAVVDPGITLSDDGSTLASAVISVTGGFQAAEDRLTFIANGSTGDINGSYNPLTGVLSLQSSSGTATIAQWQAALHSTVYRNVLSSPTVNTRTISFLVSDGALNSNAVTKAVSIALPAAVVDNYSYQSGTALTIPAPGVLGNDTSPGGSPLSAILVTGPANGTLVLNPNGGFTYTSNGATSDQFTYKVNNGDLDGNTITVTLTRANSSPVAVNDTYTVTANTPFSGNVFNNDSDPDGDQLLITANTSPAHGTLVLNPNGSFTYTPNIGTTGDDTFNYQVCDNGIPSFCSSATVVFHVLAPANTAPVVIATAGTTLFSGTDAFIDPGITVTDDGSTLASGVVSISGGFHSPEDQLALIPDASTGDIVGFYNGGSGFLALGTPSGTATVAQWQAAMRRIVYRNAQGVPTVNTRTISFLVSDGHSNSKAVTKTVSIVLPSISAGGTLPALNTTYGTASASGTFNVSGTNLTAGILVTAPTGFEVSIDNVTFTHTVTIGSGGNIASTLVQVRLAAGNNAGTYSGFVALSSAGAGGINVPTVASTVSPKKLTITAKNVTKTYGQTLTGGAITTEFTASGLVGTETVGNVTLVYGTGAAANAAVTTYTGMVTVSAANGGTFNPANYAINYIAGNIVVNKAALTVTANNKGKAFGTALASGTGSVDFTSTGLANAETIGSVTITYGAGAAANAVAGTYPGSIVPSAATGGTFKTSNYNIIYKAGTLSVGQAILTITVNNATKTYGAAIPALSVSYSGFTGGDNASSLTVQPTISVAAVPNSPVGIYAITASGAVSSNYTIVYQPGTLNVTPAALTVKANNRNKIYGQNLTGGAGSTAFTSTGLVGAETIGSVTITYGTGAAVGAPVNTYTGSIVPGFATGGTFNATNYNITYAAGDITVGKAPIIVTADVQNKIYGDVDPTLTYAVTTGALVGTDTFTGVLTRAPGENAGTYAISRGTLALNNNYTLTYAGASFTINKAAITLTADPQTKSYGSVDPALTFMITNGVLKFADTFTGALSRAPGENAGTYAIQRGTLALSSNYTLTYVGANLTIGKADITVTADMQSKAFGAADPPLTFKITSGGLKFADTFTGALTRVAGESTGTYAIQQGSLALSSNYNLIYVGANFSIGKTTITVTADVQTKTYGDVDPVFTYKITSGVLTPGDKFTGTLTRVAGENAGTYAIQQGSLTLGSNYTLNFVGANLTIGKAAITVTADAQTKAYGGADPVLTYKVTSGALKFADTFTGALSRAPGENAGTYAIQQGTLALSSNYTLTYVGANLTIGKITITVTADVQNKIYGATDPVLTYKITSGALVGKDNFTGILTRAAGENAGIYAIQKGTLAPGGNYTLTYVGADLTIDKAAVTVTADAQNKVYGTADPVLTYKITSGTLKFADTFTGSLTRAAGENVGSYVIQQGTLALSNNYTLTYAGAKLSIDKAGITVTANSQNKIYGAADPALTYTITTGTLVGTDKFTGALTRAAGENVGIYAIQQGTLVLNSNYTLTYIGANLTIGKAAITVTADAQAKVYGVADPVLTYKITTGALVGTDKFTGILTRVAGENVGSYAIHQGSLALNSNYTLTYIDANLSIGKAAITVTAKAQTKVYGASDPALTYTITTGALVGTDKFTGALTRTGGENVGTYPIQQGTLVLNSNYALTYVGANLTVTQRTLTITANNANKIYGSANPVLSVSYNGFVNGDNSNNLTTKPVIATTATQASAAGTYPITASGAAIANYKIVYADGTLTINKATLTITVEDKSRLYGVANPVFTEVYSGFVNGDTQAVLTKQPVLATVANSTSLPGLYPITVSGAISANYMFNYVPGKLTVIALSNAKLINLVPTSGTLTPSFNSDNFSYNAQVDNEIQGVRLTLTFDPTATATINGSSASNDRQSFFIPLNVGNNTISIIVTAQDHITKNTYTLFIYRGEDQRSIIASNILTPNGDGKNDTWVIADIQLFPNNTVTVFDKAGRTVYSKHGYTNDWNGTYGGAPLTEGTYYYIVDLGPQKRQFKGFITIIHDR
ncbi:MBG domain-containing protein [Mucilaginibacter sp. RCC_168]|uniref:MBG domain-containing protein n=1 Tax=Mucilaginibacter sp. RCC_168 TaxID=3239221 RepID=UPI003523F4E4